MRRSLPSLLAFCSGGLSVPPDGELEERARVVGGGASAVAPV